MRELVSAGQDARLYGRRDARRYVADPRSSSLPGRHLEIIRVGERTLDRFTTRQLHIPKHPAYANSNQADPLPHSAPAPVRPGFVEWRRGADRFRRLEAVVRRQIVRWVARLPD